MTGVYAFLLCGLAAICEAIYSALTRPDVLILWSPIWLLLIPAAMLLFIELYRINPSGFSNSITDKTSYHTRVLYEATSGVFRELRSRTDGSTNSIVVATVSAVRMIALIAIPVYIALLAAPFFTSSNSPVWTSAIMRIIGRSGVEQQRIAECGMLGLIWVVVLCVAPRMAQPGLRQSVPALIQRYREYAKEVVYRVSKGALGEAGKGIVICVDELDKISDITELKAFLSLAKTLFDIDGVTYYLSMADDALTSMALGSAIGKDEFDSSFDHVERVKPLSWADSSEVAAQYFREQLQKTISFDEADIIGFLSFGVPRDIVRKCETALAAGVFLDRTSSIVTQVFGAERQEKSAAAYALELISGTEFDAFSGGLDSAGQQVAEFMTKSHSNKDESRYMRIVFYIAILVMAEREWHSLGETGPKASRRLDELFRLGFDVSSAPVEGPLRELRRLWTANE
jgi:hypothetical protein